MFLNILTFIVMIALAALVGIAVVKLGPLPGQIAQRRGHPQAEAIGVAGWIGIITLGFLWPFALIWAYTRSAGTSTDTAKEIAGLTARIEALENQVPDPDQA
jgi:hypothetical protein